MRLWLLAFSGFLYAAPAWAQDGVFAANGKHLYLRCEGARHGAAVVLDAGLYRESSDWRLVMPEMSKFTQVCAYDREGLGRSVVDKAKPETGCVDEKLEDLRALLKAASIPAPYVLVGHSAAGITVRRFARNYPGEVAGLVFIDSAHEEQAWRFIAIDPLLVQGPPADEKTWACGGGTARGVRLEWQTDKPLVVVEHGIPLTFEGEPAAHTAEVNATLDWMARDLAERSPLGELRIALRSGHEVMLDEPQVVVEAVRDVWMATANPRTAKQGN